MTCSRSIKAFSSFGIPIKRYEMTQDNEFRAITLGDIGRYAIVVKIIVVCQIGCKHIDRFTVITESFHNGNKNMNSVPIDFVLLLIELQRIQGNNVTLHGNVVILVRQTFPLSSEVWSQKYPDCFVLVYCTH